MDHYIFDKRVMKKIFLKYGLMMLFLFPILILVNILLGVEDSTTTILVDMVIGLVYVLVVEVVISKVKKRKDAKNEDSQPSKKQADEILIQAEVVDGKKKNRRNTSKKDDN